MTEGTVKFFNEMKNFGFIDGDDGKSYFVHTTGLKEGTTIKEGDRVSFKPTQGEKGPKAEEVEKLKGEKPAKEAKASEEENSEEE